MNFLLAGGRNGQQPLDYNSLYGSDRRRLLLSFDEASAKEKEAGRKDAQQRTGRR